MALKASDSEVIPLAPHIHDELHRGGYRSWENKYGSQLAWLKRIVKIMKNKGVYQDYFPDEDKDISHKSSSKTTNDAL